MNRTFRCFVVFACLVLAAACDNKGPDPEAAHPTPSAARSSQAAAAPSASAPRREEPKHALTNAQFAKLFVEASEPGKYFFSDNYVSNETSYLQVARALEARGGKGGAYVGVGPEQNFSYLAILKPALAFIVDIRRANALEHLWYKALFQGAKTRFQFLAELIGRPTTETGPKDDGLEAIIELVAALPKTEVGYAQTLSTRRSRILGWGISLSPADEKALQSAQRAFYDEGLSLAFQLHEKNGRTYPTLRKLLMQRDPSGSVGGFLSSRAAFQVVKRMQKENRIIPIVGDFAGPRALSRIAQELKQRDLPVRAFYVSNVEQYLLEPEVWPKWVANVAALPANESSVFIRCYLDQGRRHPKQLPKHRTATVLSSFDHFKWRSKKKPFKNFYEISTDGILED